MDATYTSFKKLVLFLLFALLCLGPWSSAAHAQSLVICGSGTVNTNFASGPVTCALSSSGADFAFSVTPSAITYSSNSPSRWLGVSPTSGTTPATLILSLTGGAGLTPGNTYTATIPINATAPATGGTLTLNFSPGSSGGNTGLITASPTSLIFCPTSACNTQQTVTLSTTSTASVPFTIAAPSWLTVSPTSGTVSSASNATLTLSVNNFPVASNANLTIGYSGGQTTVAINIAGGSGNLTASPNSVQWSYATGGTLPSNQLVALTETGAATQWAAVATPASGDPVWVTLSVAGGAQSPNTGYVPFTTASSFTVIPIPSNVAGLTTGVHTTTIAVSDSSGNQSNVIVTLTVNGTGSNNGMTITPGSITLPQVALGSTTTVSATASVTTATNSGNLSLQNSGYCPGINTGISTATITPSFGATLTVYGNPSGLAQATYNQCNIIVTLTNSSTTVASITVPITWVVGTGSGTGANQVLPTTLNFVEQAGNSNSVIQQLVAVTGAGSWSATPAQTWIKLNPSSGSGPGTLTVTVDPTTLPAGSTAGSISFTTASGNQTVTVNTLISSSPVIYATPFPVLVLTADSGFLTNGATYFQILASDGSAVPYTVASTVNWLTVPSSTTSGTTPGLESLTTNIGQLANGVYSGAINVTATSGTVANPTLTVPVVLTVTNSTVSGSSLTFNTSALTFSGVSGGSSPSAQTLTATAPSGVTYTVSTSTSNGVNWLAISPSGSVSISPMNFSVTATQGTLAAGTYTGTITFVLSNGVTQTVNVTLNVTGAATTVTFNPTSLTFNATVGSTTPSAQTFTVSSAAGAAATTFTLNTDSSWLTATAAGTNTPTTITVTANPSGLAAQTYSGNVVITPNGGTAQKLPVTFTITSATVTASPTTLNLAYALGGTPPTATINVGGTGAGGAALNYTATLTSACNCLAISPTSGTTTANPTITVTLLNPTSQTAGTFTGTVAVAGTNGATGNTIVNITLTVTAPLPTIASIANAASGATGAIAPGEIVSLFGTAANPIGPATPVQLTSSLLTSSGNVPTTMGGVTVTFNGRQAPLLYVSATQVNAVVPYGVAGFNNFPVIVNYLGQNSNGFTVQTTTTVPGIFTQNGAGTGPAAILNSDGGTVNGPNAPAAKGSTVAVFMTGEGATTPQGVDGKVTCAAGCTSLSQIPIPLLPVSVLVDGQPATVVFHGEAPSLVSGVMQVNFTIPTTVRSGNVPLVITVGGNQSQGNVTVSVQ